MDDISQSLRNTNSDLYSNPVDAVKSFLTWSKETGDESRARLEEIKQTLPASLFSDKQKQIASSLKYEAMNDPMTYMGMGSIKSIKNKFGVDLTDKLVDDIRKAQFITDEGEKLLIDPRLQHDEAVRNYISKDLASSSYLKDTGLTRVSYYEKNPIIETYEPIPKAIQNEIRNASKIFDEPYVDVNLDSGEKAYALGSDPRSVSKLINQYGEGSEGYRPSVKSVKQEGLESSKDILSKMDIVKQAEKKSAYNKLDEIAAKWMGVVPETVKGEGETIPKYRNMSDSELFKLDRGSYKIPEDISANEVRKFVNPHEIKTIQDGLEYQRNALKFAKQENDLTKIANAEREIHKWTQELNDHMNSAIEEAVSQKAEKESMTAKQRMDRKSNMKLIVDKLADKKKLPKKE